MSVSVSISAIDHDAPDSVRIAVVGDSLTAGGGRLLSDGLTQNTWLTYTIGGGIDYVGGWAKGGSTIQEQATHVTSMDDIDVLIMITGTNNVRQGQRFQNVAYIYKKIVDTIGADIVIVGDIPPYDRRPEEAADYRHALAAYALSHDWNFVDPWASTRNGDVFANGMSKDGIHPTTCGYARAGHYLRSVILSSVITTREVK